MLGLTLQNPAAIFAMLKFLEIQFILYEFVQRPILVPPWYQKNLEYYVKIFQKRRLINLNVFFRKFLL